MVVGGAPRDAVRWDQGEDIEPPPPPSSIPNVGPQQQQPVANTTTKATATASVPTCPSNENTLRRAARASSEMDVVAGDDISEFEDESDEDDALSAQENFIGEIGLLGGGSTDGGKDRHAPSPTQTHPTTTQPLQRAHSRFL